MIWARLLADSFYGLFLENVGQCQFHTPAGVRGRYKFRDVDVVADPQPYVLQVEEDVHHDGIAPSVKEASSHGKNRGVTVLPLEILDIHPEGVFAEPTLPTAVQERLQGKVVGYADS